jgi:molybdopterin synthase catalytic subunit
MKPQVVLSSAPIVPEAAVFASEVGAEVSFLGIVRGTEGGEPIGGIDYTAYETMALKMLEEMVSEGQHGQPDHEVYVQHRLGPVLVGEPSVIIRVQAKHSAEAFAVCQHYLRELKTRVPIWKRMLPACS